MNLKVDKRTSDSTKSEIFSLFVNYIYHNPEHLNLIKKMDTIQTYQERRLLSQAQTQPPVIGSRNPWKNSVCRKLNICTTATRNTIPRFREKAW